MRLKILVLCICIHLFTYRYRESVAILAQAAHNSPFVRSHRFASRLTDNIVRMRNCVMFLLILVLLAPGCHAARKGKGKKAARGGAPAPTTSPPSGSRAQSSSPMQGHPLAMNEWSRDMSSLLSGNSSSSSSSFGAPVTSAEAAALLYVEDLVVVSASIFHALIKEWKELKSSQAEKRKGWVLG